MQIRCFGDNCRQGTYVLFISLSQQLNTGFGKFLNGKNIPFEPGFYLYIGSALGNSDVAMPLARRLVRHASRSGGKTPHTIRNRMIRFLHNNNLATKELQPPAGKKLHWHIDYLLDSPCAEIETAFIIRSPLRMETILSNLVASLDETFIIAPGLGARDTRNSTHLLGISNLDSCLTTLEQKIPSLLNEQAASNQNSPYC